MKIKLKLDYDGNPYLELEADNETLEDEALKLFIREAEIKGIELTDTDSDCGDRFADIVLKYPNKKSK